MRFPYLPVDQIDDAALALLSKAFHDPCVVGPKVDLEAVVFDYLVEQEQLYFTDQTDLGHAEGDKVIGKTLPVAGKVMVCRTVREDGPAGRYRFTVAHELGHWVLHRPLFLAQRQELDLFRDSAEPDSMVSLHRDVFPSGRRSPPPEEWQANRFAVALLVSKELLRAEFVTRFREAPITCSPGELRSRSREVARELVEGRPSLAQTFGLSIEAMAICLESRGYVTDHAPML